MQGNVCLVTFDLACEPAQKRCDVSDCCTYQHQIEIEAEGRAEHSWLG